MCGLIYIKIYYDSIAITSVYKKSQNLLSMINTKVHICIESKVNTKMHLWINLCQRNARGTYVINTKVYPHTNFR